MTNQIIAIDLGSRSTKAVCLQKEGETLSLVGYAIQDRPQFGKTSSPEQLARHIESVARDLNAKTRDIVVSVGASDSVLCHAEMPLVGTSQMRKMVKLNPKLYFQEDLPHHIFDCLVLHQGVAQRNEAKQLRKTKTLVVAIKNQLVRTLQESCETAGFKLNSITAAANCLVVSHEAKQEKVVALVDIGFSHSTISVLVNGEITLTRVVNLGADKFTSGLAEAMNITYSVAESLKQIMPEKVNAQLKALVSPLCHELSNSIHFFEQQQDAKVSEVYVSGGSARSAFILEILREELHLPCKTWDLASVVKNNLPDKQAVSFKQDAPQLAVAIGAALSNLKPELDSIDLLAEQKEEAEIRSRDPMKRGYAIAAALVVLMFGWYGVISLRAKSVAKEFESQTAEINALQPDYLQASANEKKLAKINNTLDELDEFAANRFLWASALNAFQQTVVDNFQMVRLQISQEVSQTRAIPAVTNVNHVVIPGRPAETLEKTVFRVQAKSFSKPSAAEGFMNAISTSPWFRENLRAQDPVRLTESQAPIVDTKDPSKMTIFFTVECYAEHKL